MKLSIITINRNNSKGLEQTIESVLAQTFRDFEYVIIDGASSDGSVDLIRKYADDIHSWVSEPDKGIFNAMNKGIRRAKGEYLLFLNSGDRLAHPGVLDLLRDATEDVVYGDIRYEDEVAPFVMPDRLTLETFLGPSIGHNASFIKATLFEKYGLYNEDNKIVSDLEFFMIAIIKHRSTYRHIGQVLTLMQSGGVSITRSHEALKKEERMACFKRAFPEFYNLIAENFRMKEELAFYEQSRPVQFVRKLQQGRFNKLKNKYLRH